MRFPKISKKIDTFQSDSSPNYVSGTWKSNFFSQKVKKFSLCCSHIEKERIHIHRLLTCLRCRLRLRRCTSSSMPSRFCCHFNRHRRCRLPNRFVVTLAVIAKNVSFKCPFFSSFSLSPSSSAFSSLLSSSIVFFESLFTQIKKHNSLPLTARK